MQKFKFIIRLISLLSVLFGLICFIIAPSTIATHIADNDKVDAVGPAWQIFILPVLQLLVNELLIFKAKRQRVDNDCVELNFLLPNEQQYIVIAIIVLVVFAGAMYQQITL
ncbi:DUF1648 domain-containing protein [Loigolactobacillus binensis]|uniref:DUF1648 domain-containing protein n=1 Tax=Loigolactobacillus binensis TaxID=2559922 RepID=A0ABW3E906_9LACO|nr:DUF1648 domain-containing protein [Loigolactobacillus binensis]